MLTAWTVSYAPGDARAVVMIPQRVAQASYYGLRGDSAWLAFRTLDDARAFADAVAADYLGALADTGERLAVVVVDAEGDRCAVVHEVGDADALRAFHEVEGARGALAYAPTWEV